MAVVGIACALLLAVQLILTVLIPLIIIPLLEVYAPFGDRIRIVTGQGTLVLRDVPEAEDFVAAVRRQVRVVER